MGPHTCDLHSGSSTPERYEKHNSNQGCGDSNKQSKPYRSGSAPNEKSTTADYPNKLKK